MRLLLVICLAIITAKTNAQEPAALFSGEKTSWHEGFDRYDFLMDELTLEVTPIKATEEEKYGAKPAERGMPTGTGMPGMVS